jgi:hypothetical protein
MVEVAKAAAASDRNLFINGAVRLGCCVALTLGYNQGAKVTKKTNQKQKLDF